MAVILLGICLISAGVSGLYSIKVKSFLKYFENNQFDGQAVPGTMSSTAGYFQEVAGQCAR